MNRRLHGTLKAIWEQSDRKKSESWFKEWFKKLSVLEDGFPSEIVEEKYKGKTIKIRMAKSLANCTQAEGLILMNTLQVWCDERNMYTYAYDEKEIPFRSVGGRTRQEMDLYIADLEKKGDIEYAKILRQLPTKKKTDAEEIVAKVFKDVEIF